MENVNSYTCKVCNKKHNIFQAIQSPLPQRILEIPETDRSQRVKDMQGSYLVDGGTFLLKGDIFIYKKGEEQPFFTWAVWASISFPDFVVKAEELKQKKTVAFEGLLESELPCYKRSKGLKAKVFVNIDYDYAVIKIQDKSSLKKDQVEKITDKRVLELMEGYYHG